METLIYNNHNIEITTDGSTKFIFTDHQERTTTEYDYDELSNFTDDILYLPEYIALEILSAIDDYYDSDSVNGTITFTVIGLPRSEWHDLLRKCNELSKRYTITYESDIN